MHAIGIVRNLREYNLLPCANLSFGIKDKSWSSFSQEITRTNIDLILIFPFLVIFSADFKHLDELRMTWKEIVSIFSSGSKAKRHHS